MGKRLQRPARLVQSLLTVDDRAAVVRPEQEEADRLPAFLRDQFGVAAVNLGRQFAGSDICAEAVEITRSRLKEAFDAKAKFDNVAASGGS